MDRTIQFQDMFIERLYESLCNLIQVHFITYLTFPYADIYENCA